ncbi:P-loop NTPase fold protein [Altererythrobacter sp. Root672]|uniref:P-loop NTPase fold protein n=1 Tax=Altererythrobacter sp. Root672 TaxID=1736584 RepID=UPI0006F8E05D|nr:P-loop NTPase fold protein [Altererythrobacter sp. Root672]KRA81629.1 hypothetical protein ASD76_13990 [Altererythrobacter sp. Root672]
MADIEDPNNHIRGYLRDYLALTQPPGYAVMVRGPWGIGKTFLIKNILAEQFPEEKSYIYVSLYGVASPGEIDGSIFAETHPILGSKAAKVVGRAVNAGLKFGGLENPLSLQDFVSRTTGSIYIFDDVERSSMSSDAIFGYINQFVEHAGCRVVLVANEIELEKTPGYRSKREKLIGQTLEAKSSVRSALAAFLANIGDGDARNYLTTVADYVVELYDQGDVSNLRVLKQTIWDYERFYGAIEEKHRENAHAMLHVLQLLFALSFEIKLGRIGKAELSDRISSWIASSMRNGEPSAFKDACDRYAGVDLHSTTLSDELLEELLVRGVVDANLIQRDLEASSWFVSVEDEPSWRTLWHRLDREDEAVSVAIQRLASELNELHYIEPGEILHVFGLLLKLSDAGLIVASRDEVVAQAKGYIDALRNTGRLPPLTSAQFFEDIRHAAWGGLGITETGTTHYREIYDYLRCERELAATDLLPARADQLMQEIDTDPDLFCRRLVGTGGEQSVLIEGPVLSKIPLEDFLAAVQRQTASAQSRIYQTLLSRYGHGGFAQGLEGERPWAKTLVDLMRKQAESAEPVRRHKLNQFADWLGDAVKDASEMETAEDQDRG